MAGDNVSAADTDGFEKPVVDAFAAGEEALLGVVAESVKARITGRVSRGQGLKAFRKSARKVVTDTISRGVAASRAALDRAAEAGRAVARRVIERQRRAPDPSPLEASPDTPTPNTGGLTAEQLRATAPKAPRSARGVTVRTPKALVPGVQAMAPTLLANAEGLYKEITEAVIAAPLESEAARRRLAQSMLDKAAARGITGFVDKAGRRWSMVSYIEMATRTAATQTAVEAHAQMLVDNGHDLVRVSVHPNCSPMCAPFQGHLLSLTGATSAAGPEPWRKRVVATFAEAKARGFLHPNCKHWVQLWQPGDPLPDAPEVDPDDYTAEQNLRKLERGLRAARRRRKVALDPVAERQANTQIRELRRQIAAHIEANPTLQRQPEREKDNLGYRDGDKPDDNQRPGSGGGDDTPPPTNDDVPAPSNDDGETLAALLTSDFADWAENLTAEQRTAIVDWQLPEGRFYQKVQAFFRKGVADDEDAVRVALTVAKAIKAGRLVRDIQVWRGVRNTNAMFQMHNSELESLVGRNVPADGLFAVSTSRRIAVEEFTDPSFGGGPVLLRVQVPAGTPAAWLPSGGDPSMAYQRELLLSDAHQLRVLSVDYTGDLPVMDVEVI